MRVAKIKSKKTAQVDQFQAEGSFVRKSISLDTRTDKMLKEICLHTGAGQSSLIRQMIEDLHKKLKLN